MALPRWVLSELVDSIAMRTAFVTWRESNPELAQQLGLAAGLPIIIHSPEVGPTEIDMVEIPCPRGARCKICSKGRMGYTFRWFSSLWLELYMQLRRDDTWLPGDPEGVRVTPLRAGSIGELVDEKGHAVEEM